MFELFDISARKPDCIRVIQITDTHIFESEQGNFDGLNTSESLDAVIGQVKQQQADIVLVTGDLVHDPVPLAYSRLAEQLLELEVPTFCLPGNHDDPALMHAHLNQGSLHTSKLIRAGGWTIVLLDTFLEGSEAGRLEEKELQFLGQCLTRYRGEPAMVCLHHPPVSIASPWMDGMMLQNPDSLFSVLDQYEEMRALIWGHIHQEFRAERRGVMLYGSPSTCIQFKPKSETFALDELAPGYSLVQLHGDGEIAITTERI